MSFDRNMRSFVEGYDSSSGWLREGVRPAGLYYGDESVVRRGLLRGNNAIARGKRVLFIPRVSERDYQDILRSTGESHTDEIHFFLSKLCERGSDTWRNYAALHVAKRKQLQDSQGAEYNVVLNPNPVYAPPAELRMSKAASNVKVKKYTLAQIFCDSYLADKYQLSSKFRRDMQVMAITRPYDAATTLREAIQHMSPGVKILVEAGGYSKTRQQAIATIRNLSQGKPLLEASVVADVIGSQVVVFGPGDLDRKGWMIQGPTKHMESIMDVHKLVTYAGLHEVMFLLSMETLILGIEMYDGKNYISPTIISHAPKRGVSLPAHSDVETLELLNDVTRSRLNRLVDNVLPVMKDGVPSGSAVQVGPKMILMNEHLKDPDSLVEVAGVDIGKGGVPVTHDLWMHYVAGKYTPWTLRSANVGETVAILYHNGVSPILSPHFSIVSSDESLIMSKACADVIPGMSGGALIALSDMSLLGLHSGEAMRNLFASAYTDTMNLDLMQMSVSEDGQLPSQGDANALFEQMQARGMRDEFASALLRMVALSAADGEHVATAMAVGGRYYSTCQPQEYAIDDAVEKFYSENPFVVSASSPTVGPIVQENADVVFRQPNLHERVVVAVKKGQDIYFSHETVVKQVGVSNKNFFLRATSDNVCSLLGGIVVSTQDAAVLGMYVREANTVGLDALSMCVPFPSILSGSNVDQVALSEVIQKKLPMVHTAAWDAAVLGRVFTHESAAAADLNNKALATMGRATVTHALYAALRRSTVPPERWRLYESQFLSVENLVSVYKDLQIDMHLKGKYGLVLDDVQDSGADALLALIQVVADYEDYAVLDQVLALFGLVPEPSEIRGPDDVYARMMRRPSELGFREVDIDGGTRIVSPID